MDDQFLRDLKKQPATRVRGATARDVACPPSARRRARRACGRLQAVVRGRGVDRRRRLRVHVAARAGRSRSVSRSVPRQAIHGCAVRPGAAPAVWSRAASTRRRSSAPSSRSTTPQEPVSYATAADAGAAAGIRVRTPAWVPQGYSSTGFMASSEHAARITVKRAGLQALLDTLGLADVELPEGLDGQTATVRVPPIVTQTFVNGERNVHVIQAESPDVSFPAGLDLSKLAYAGLRVLGMSRDEAYRMSVTIDWRSTLIVPVPSKAAAYRPINVAGNEGLLIEGARGQRDPRRRRADVVRGRRDVRGRGAGQWSGVARDRANSAVDAGIRNRNRGVAARVRPQRRGGRFVPRRPARRGFRLFGAERRRQDDVAEAAARPRRADVGQRHRARRAARQYRGRARASASCPSTFVFTIA